MITEGGAAIPQETTLHAFRNLEKTKQRSTITIVTNLTIYSIVISHIHCELFIEYFYKFNNISQ